MRKTYCQKYVTTLLCILSLLSGTVYSEFGDYVDPTFNCPAMTTCPVMCVWDEWFCPPMMRCPSGTDLCLDGTCVNSTIGCDPNIESPCWENVCGNEVACAKIVDYYDKCLYDHDFMYTNATECVDEWRMPVVPWNAPGFVACYAWISGITFFIIVWCACNQRFFPVGEAEPLLDASKMLVTVERLKREMARQQEEFIDDDNMEASEKVDIDWTQTAYENTFIGNLLYWCTVLTMWAFQVLLLLLVLGFYATENEYYHLTPIKDTKQILFAFQLVWMVGFVWCLSLKWPSSLRSLFLRRSHFNTATHVAVFSPETGNLNVSKDERINIMAKFINLLGGCINGFFMLLFSDVNRTKHGTTTFCKVETDAFGERFFTYRFSRYTYDEEEGCFKPGVIVVGSTIGEIIDSNVGLTSEEVKYRHSVVGPNSLPIRKPSFIRIVIEEFNQAFYLYQNYMVWTWLNYWYYHMGIVESIVRIVGGIAVSVVKYKMAKNICRLGTVIGEVEVLRDGEFVTISQQDIVPGEVVSVTPGIVYCDMVLIQGSHVLVDESALTGEANPIYKTKVDLAANKEAYDPKTHKVHTISAGTSVIESDTKERDLAVVVKTGSFTAKGELLRGMLYNTPHKFKFDTEVMIVLCILFIEAVIFFGVTFHFLQEEPVYAWFFGMFVVATCIPPLLPTVFVVSVGISAERLLRKRIAVTDNARILVAGKVQVAFFDKTGTLTKQGLEFQVARSYKDGAFDDLSTPSGNLGMGMTVCHTLTESSDHKIVGHLLERIMFEETNASFMPYNSKSTKVQIKTKDGSVLNVLKRFEFDYTTQTQSVLVEDDKGKYYVFAKGSVEAIKKICHESTMPHDINEVSAASSREGIYQIAFAMSEVSEEISNKISSHSVSEDGEIVMQDDVRDDFLARLPREKLEENLTFIGFIDFINTMKEETPGVLKTLEEGDIRTIMLTGDSVLTGIHIAKKGGMIAPDALVILGKDIDEEGNVEWVDSITSKPMKLPSQAELRSQKSSIALAVTGKVWSHMLETNEDLADYLAYYIRVHGRCTPHDKVSVASYFVKKGYMTLMCGDGGNDCGALKTAHVGIALSDAEASVVSPFTSMDKSIESVVEVLKEGRCALCSALASYKYMIMYGQVETINQVVCAYFKTTPGDWNWIFMDGIWVIIMAFTLPLAKAAKKLAPSRPTSSLLGPHTMTSAIGILAINFFFVAIALWLLHQQDWFQCRKWDGGKGLANLSYICDNYETSVIFLISGYQYINSAVPYNFGFAYRADWIKNYIFVFFAVAFTALHFYITLVPGSVSCLFRVNCVNEKVVPDPFGDIIAIQNSYHTTIMPMDFRVILISIMIMNLAANILWEYFIVNGDYSWWTNYKKKHE